MSQGSIIGYDINTKTCQISSYNEELQEPVTMEYSKENFEIPLVVNCYKDEWTYGRNAIRMESVKGSILIDNLFQRALRNEKIDVEGEEYEAVRLLAEFIGQTLKDFEEIRKIVFTVPEMNEDVRCLLKGIGQRLGIAKEHILVQDYKESFCHYMFNQPKELWQFESALFYCDQNVIQAYMLRELKTGSKTKDCFVTVEKVADAKMEELEQIHPALSIDRARAADEHFRKFIQSVFRKKTVSSVYLTGAGFEHNWYPNSLRVLCNGRRAFMGNNLYSKGACYMAHEKVYGVKESAVYLDDSKLSEQITVKMRVNGEEVMYPLVTWGAHWYESDQEFEVLLEDLEDIELYVESLATKVRTIEKVSLHGLPDRNNYTTRLKVSVVFLDEKTCRILLEDVGFGDFFPASGFVAEKVIELGGSNGQFNSLS